MLRLQKSIAILAIVTCASATSGGLIEGPADFPSNLSGHSRWGIRFTVLKQSRLRSFDYAVQNNKAGRVELINTTTDTTVFANDHAASTTGVVEYDGLAISHISLTTLLMTSAARRNIMPPHSFTVREQILLGS